MKIHVIIVLLLTLLLPAEMSGAKKRVIHSKEMGLLESNSPEQNGKALEKMAHYAATHPNTTIEIAQGIYRVKREIQQQILFRNCVNTTFNGNGAEFIFMETEKKMHGNFIRIEQSKNFILKNLVIDWDWDIAPLSAVAQLEKYDKEGIYFKLMHEGIKTLPEIHMGREWDINTNCRSLEGYALFGGYALDARLIDSHHIYVKVKNPDKLQATDIGKYCHLRFNHNYFAGAIGITDCSNVHIEGITIYSCPETAFSCYATRGLTIKGSSVMPRPGSNRFYTAHSAGELHNSFGEIIYENNRIIYSYDDGLHISSGFTPPYLEREGKDAFSVRSKYLQHYFMKDVIRKGDVFEILGPNFKPTGFKAKLVSFEWKFNVRKHSAPHDCVLTFDKEVPSELLKDHYLFNTALTDVSYQISGNEFAYNGCHGIHAGMPNGTIENNKFYRTGYPALNMTLVLRWGRWVIGPSPSNVKVLNNILDECDVAKRQPACMFVGAGIDPQGGDFSPVDHTAVENVVIKGNIIKNSDMPAFGAWSIKNLLVKDNMFENVARNPVSSVQNKGAVFIEYAKEVTIQDNTLIQPTALKNKGLSIDTKTTEKITVNNWKEKERP